MWEVTDTGLTTLPRELAGAGLWSPLLPPSTVIDGHVAEPLCCSGPQLPFLHSTRESRHWERRLA